MRTETKSYRTGDREVVLDPRWVPAAVAGLAIAVLALVWRRRVA